MAIELATAYVSILPSTRGLGSALATQLDKEVPKAGEKSGGGLGSALMAGVKRTGIGAAIAVGGILTGALVKGWGRLNAIENATAKLRGLGHSGKEVDQIMADALASVKGTAFGLDAAATVSASAVAAGVKPGKELERTLRLVADAATIGGTSMTEMGGIFNKVAASGKVQGDVINQLNDRGIPIIQLLSKTLGLSAAETVKLASQGKVNFATFQKAMESGLGGAALKSGDTTSGAFANMGAAMSRFGARLLKDVFPVAKVVFGALTDFFDQASTVLGPFVDVVSKRLAVAFKVLGSWLTATFIPAMKGVWQWMGQNRELLVAVGSALGVLLVAWGAYRAVLLVQQGITMAVTAVQWLLNAALSANPIGIVVLAIAALIGALVFLYQKNETVRNIVNAVWGAIKVAIGAVVDWFSNTAWPIIRTVAGYIGAYYQVLFSIIKVVWSGISAAISVFVGWFRNTAWPIIKTVAGYIGGYYKTLWTIVSGAWNGIRGAISTVVDWFSKTAWPRIRAVADLIKGIWNGIAGAARAAFGGVARAWNGTVGSLSFTLPDWIPLVGGKTFSMPKLPELANGGIVTRPTLALIGEAGPEAVVPLGRGGAAGGVIINVDARGSGDPVAVQAAVRKGVAEGMRAATRRVQVA